MEYMRAGGVSVNGYVVCMFVARTTLSRCFFVTGAIRMDVYICICTYISGYNPL